MPARETTCSRVMELSPELHCGNDERMGRRGMGRGWRGQRRGSCSPTLASSTFSRSVSSDTLLQLRQPAGREEAGAGGRHRFPLEPLNTWGQDGGNGTPNDSKPGDSPAQEKGPQPVQGRLCPEAFLWLQIL